MASGNWIVDNLNNALNTWNDKLGEIWNLITQSPETFKGGAVWNVIVNIHGAVQAIGLGLLVLFFVVGVMKTLGSFAEVKRPEVVLKLFFRFVLAKAAVTYGLELMMALFQIIQGLMSTIMGAPGITEEQAKKLDNKVTTATVSWERQPFASYDLTNNNSEIKRLKSRIAELTRNQEIGFSSWEFNGGRAEANTDMNRLQLFFDEKPNEQQRAQLKANGFKWAPSQDAWQRQLNDNAIYAAGRLDFVKPSDGRTVREHQPKAPAKDTGVR